MGGATGMTILIALADDQPVLRECVCRLLADEKDIQIVAQVGDGQTLLDLLATGTISPDLAIVDIEMPGIKGFEVARRISSLHPQVKVLMLTSHCDQEYVGQSLRAGAVGFLLKDDAADELVPAIHTVAGGAVYISSTFGFLRKDARQLFHSGS